MNTDTIKDLVKKILTSDSEIKILYDRQILFDMTPDLEVEGSENIYFLDELHFEEIRFFELEELEIPDDIVDFVKLLNKIKKSDLEKECPDYLIALDEDINFISEDSFNELYSLEYLEERLRYLQIFKVQYLKPERIKL